ncbi:hypothetical protein J2Y45_003601 [Dyadobacter sp. BE34]|uniref:DUF3396 domain-containing protein n=1 Tax=Dyadobacter fermentans TaxID=94254 RepID=A0ABU1R0J0_9BACT|nr:MULTISPECIES: hypothetical protein [Dyadobacter]MDR6806409.1 hypothetical protein [Dyadobacter fermentans]MDR7044150.1 hypothetical protein [Dyadobacter sp. BE242]MDR7198461.1 hypothetical protein [Dyadobacter sp. BE34]MDR7216423.1 hypothetical protein [Dyadobacter sp. BE31]MDR7264050.1 hypothetical protein [Dyadobacter sp. BE32]
MISDFSHYASELELIVEDSKAIVPCMSFNLYMDGTDKDGVLNFYDRTRQALSGFLTHYLTDSMARRAKINLRSENLVPNLMRKLSASKIHYIAFSGCGERDSVSEASIEFSIFGWPPPSDQMLAQRRANWRVLHQRGGDLFLPMTKVRVTLPLDHSLSRDPDTLLEWVSGFSLVKDGNFLFGSCGLGVNYDEYTGSSIVRPLMMQKLADICTKYQGTEWSLPAEFERRLFQWSPEEDDIIPQIPRVSWLTLLGPECQKFLRKKDITLEDRLDKSRVKLYSIGASFILRAGREPAYGGAFGNDVISCYRHIAEVLMPLQMPPDVHPVADREYSWMRRWQYFL